MCRITLRKADSVFRDAVNVGCGNVRAPLTPEVRVTEIIRQKDDNVWSIGGRDLCGTPETRCQGDEYQRPYRALEASALHRFSPVFYWEYFRGRDSHVYSTRILFTASLW